MRPVFRPNFNERCSSGRYSVRSKWSRESGRCLLSFASDMKEDNARADLTWHANRVRWEIHDGSKMNQNGSFGKSLVHRAIPNSIDIANPTEMMSYSKFFFGIDWDQWKWMNNRSVVLRSEQQSCFERAWRNQQELDRTEQDKQTTAQLPNTLRSFKKQVHHTSIHSTPVYKHSAEMHTSIPSFSIYIFVLHLPMFSSTVWVLVKLLSVHHILLPVFPTRVVGFAVVVDHAVVASFFLHCHSSLLRARYLFFLLSLSLRLQRLITFWLTKRTHRQAVFTSE